METNPIVKNTKRWWNAGLLGKIGLGFILVLIAAVVATLARWIWNSGPIMGLRNTVSGWYSDWRSPKVDLTRDQL